MQIHDFKAHSNDRPKHADGRGDIRLVGVLDILWLGSLACKYIGKHNQKMLFSL